MGIEVVQENHHDVDKKASHSLNIPKNAVGAYRIDVNNLNFMDLDHQILSDAGQKILEVFCDDDDISIKVHANAPIHFSGEIKPKNLTIIAPGPIHIESPLSVHKTLKIKAKEVCFQSPVKCRASLLEIDGALILNAAFTAFNLMAKAATIVQHHAFKVAVASIDCQSYLQKDKADFSAKDLVLNTKKFESFGPLSIACSASLSGEELLVKEPWNISSAHFISFKNAHFAHNSSLNITPYRKYLGEIKIDSKLHIEKKVPFHVSYSFCEVGDIFTKGNEVV